MKLYRFPDNKIWKAAFCVYLLAMLVLARDTMYTTSILGFYPSQLTVAGLMVALGVVFLVYNRKRWRDIFTDKRILVLAASAILLLLPMVCKLDVQLMYFSVLLGIFFADLLCYAERGGKGLCGNDDGTGRLVCDRHLPGPDPCGPGHALHPYLLQCDGK